MAPVCLEAAVDSIAADEGVQEVLKLPGIAGQACDRPCGEMVLSMLDADSLDAVRRRDEVVLVPLADQFTARARRKCREESCGRTAVLKQVAMRGASAVIFRWLRRKGNIHYWGIVSISSVACNCSTRPDDDQLCVACFCQAVVTPPCPSSRLRAKPANACAPARPARTASRRRRAA